MYTQEPEYNKETITSDELFKLARRSKKPKIYNPKTNRMIVIDGPAYNVLIRNGYMHWKEEKVLVPPIHEKLVLGNWFAFISNRIWDIAYNPEKSLLSLIDRKTSLLQVLLEVYNDYTIRKLLKIDWNSIETRKWRNDILARFLHHPKFSPSKHKPNALYDAFTKADVLEPEHILILARAM
ncbi:24637_t:CDS:1 [Entrophospora sp. SA101]|nr:13958_t:CDS:1 [Entrophospora sp. SA101]CAJ0759975.1 3296_t:CDS:1 [Entrophospora sp. SA101]CAJ0764126.1 24637_t:CDS:1 [Entrophospora sp. SA101]CAJ0845546.1 7604_t:CDS:1 [Entrophospora sp. SA101]CAJ0851157.1 8825_t:CDS:1 [Entrophospora sp. SA101]